MLGDEVFDGEGLGDFAGEFAGEAGGVKACDRPERAAARAEALPERGCADAQGADGTEACDDNGSGHGRWYVRRDVRSGFGQEVHEFDDLLGCELFGSLFGADARWEGGGAAEGCAELFSALAEEAVAKLGESARVACEGVGPAFEHDHRAGNLWAGPEAGGVELGQDVGCCEGLDEDREQAVVGGGGLGDQSVGDFALDGRGDERAARVVDEEGQDEGGCGVVGEVGNELEGFVADGVGDGVVEALAEGEAVALDEAEAFGVALGGDAVGQEGGEVGVHLAGEDAAALGQEGLGERAGARADFEDQFAGFEVGGVEEFGEQVVVDEEVLPQRVARPQAPFGEHGLDLREGLHAGTVGGWVENLTLGFDDRERFGYARLWLVWRVVGLASGWDWSLFRVWYPNER